MAGYIGTQAVSVNTTSATISDDLAVGDDATIAGTLGVTGVVTANAGVVVDEMTLDADTLTATDTFTIDAVDDITLNCDNAGRILFGDASVIYGIASNSSSDFVLEVGTNDKAMLFKGQDNGGAITALKLDMADAGTATFNHDIKLGDDQFIFLGAGQDMTLRGDGTNGIITSPNGNLTIDCAGSITLDADAGDVVFKDGGVSIGAVINNNSDFVFRSLVSNKDVLIRGNNAGTPITALQLDMSDGGTAIFNNQIKVPNSSVAIGGTADNGFELMVTGGAKITNAGNDSHGQLRLTGTSSGDSELVMSTASNERHIYVDESDSNTLRFSGGNGKNHSSDMKISNVGNLAVGGALSKGSGSFKIRHPLEAKKNTHYLVHSFIEGPQADNIYRGKVDLVSGSATQNIDTVAGMSDGTFAALNREVQCFTTNESGWTAIKGSVSGNVLTITAQEDSCTDTISWMVIGERKDPHMMSAHTDWTDSDGKIIIEPELTDGQKSENTEYDPDCGC